MAKGMYKCTKEHKAKISKALKGTLPWNTNKNLSEEHKRKISIANKGREFSDSHRTNISKARIGMILSDEHKRHISEGHKGLIPWIAGKHHTEETKEKMRNRIFSEDHKKALSKSLLGKHCSPGTEFKKGHKVKLTKELIKKRLKRHIPTSLEQKFQEIINKHNLPYKYVGNGSFIIGHYNPDFINTDSEKIAIEVYARFYKQLDGRDIEKWKEERTKIFKEFGWEIIYFNEVQVKEEYILSVLGR